MLSSVRNKIRCASFKARYRNRRRPTMRRLWLTVCSHAMGCLVAWFAPDCPEGLGWRQRYHAASGVAVAVKARYSANLQAQ